MKSFRWVFLLVAMFFLIPALLDRNLVNGNPPALGARFISGASFSWQDYSGQPALLYYWATWCPICGAMQSSIASVAKDHAVITVALQSGTNDEIRKYLAKSPASYPVMNDPEGVFASRYGLRGVPALFFLDRHGRIRLTATGYTTEMGIRVRLWLADKMT